MIVTRIGSRNVEVVELPAGGFVGMLRCTKTRAFTRTCIHHTHATRRAAHDCAKYDLLETGERL